MALLPHKRLLVALIHVAFLPQLLGLEATLDICRTLRESRPIGEGTAEKLFALVVQGAGGYSALREELRAQPWAQP